MTRTHERELTPAAVARLLGRDAKTVRRWIREGHLRARRVRLRSGVVRYYLRPSEIERTYAETG